MVFYRLLKSSVYKYYTPIKSLKIINFPKYYANKILKDDSSFTFSKVKYICFIDNLKKNNFSWFNSYKFKINNPPKWFYDPYEKLNLDFLNKHWSEINEKDLDDLKNIWELSRWNWAPMMARAWQITGNDSYIDKLNYDRKLVNK